jgi:hypothetical protein
MRVIYFPYNDPATLQVPYNHDLMRERDFRRGAYCLFFGRLCACVGREGWGVGGRDMLV